MSDFTPTTPEEEAELKRLHAIGIGPANLGVFVPRLLATVADLRARLAERDAVMRAAELWREGHRPESWTERAHINAPTMNVTSDAGDDLAIAVACTLTRKP